ncbi:MAG: hypothetical protein AAFZ38_10435 [Myxococcota bacterium]
MVSLLALALVAAPFEDVTRRFTVDLPEGWLFVPELSKPGRAAFRRSHGGVPAQCAITTFRAPKGMALKKLIKTRGAAAKKQPDYRRIEESPAALGGFKAYRFRYEVGIEGSDGLKKTVEEWLTIGRGMVYVLHVETLSEEFDSFRRDFDRLAETLTPLDGRKQDGPIASPVIGRWVMVADPSVVLALENNGRLQLGDMHGTFTVNGSTLVTTMPQGQAEAFEWRVNGGVLVLSSPSMGAISYRRLR